jgi:hypothetical protein
MKIDGVITVFSERLREFYKVLLFFYAARNYVHIVKTKTHPACKSSLKSRCQSDKVQVIYLCGTSVFVTAFTKAHKFSQDHSVHTSIPYLPDSLRFAGYFFSKYFLIVNLFPSRF